MVMRPSSPFRSPPRAVGISPPLSIARVSQPRNAVLTASTGHTVRWWISLLTSVGDACVRRFGRRPYLGSRIAWAMVRGYQGDYSRNDNIMACLKHFALGGGRGSRDYNIGGHGATCACSINISLLTRQPSRLAWAAMMSSFNLVDGVPATANKWLSPMWLLNQWKFDGFIGNRLRFRQKWHSWNGRFTALFGKRSSMS